jgi:vacuolar-type H+-ATPase subunit F/Vma7
MSDIVLLGDELHSVGMHLAGVTVQQPTPGTAALTLAQALATARLVLLDRSVAAMLPASMLKAAQCAETPLVVVLPDLALPVADDAFAQQMQAVLGIEA